MSDITTILQLDAFIAELLSQLPQGEGATVIALHGDLGAGKTTFTQHIAAQLGVTDVVSSPTFVVMKQYDTKDDIFERLVHIDAYRIEDGREMEPLHFSSLLATPKTLLVIEWAEKIAALLPPSTKHLTLSLDGENRTIHTHA